VKRRKTKDEGERVSKGKIMKMLRKGKRKK
jgi:hypothetical protein